MRARSDDIQPHRQRICPIQRVLDRFQRGKRAGEQRADRSAQALRIVKIGGMTGREHAARAERIRGANQRSQIARPLRAINSQGFSRSLNSACSSGAIS